MEFEKSYWDEIYNPDSFIDGDYNAKEHAKYMHSIFKLLEINIHTIMDFGFGKGKMLYEVQKKFKPKKIQGLDVSLLKYNELIKKSWVKQLGLKLSNESITSFKIPSKAFDLSICNSVLQYLADDEVIKAIKILAKSSRYVYLHIPTEEDYKKLKDQFKFEDPYAYSRPLSFYAEALEPYFTYVSWGIVESSMNVDHKRSSFFDSLYRFK